MSEVLSLVLTLVVLVTALAAFMWIMLHFARKQDKKLKELHEADGFYDEQHFYNKAMLYWLPIYLVFVFFAFKYGQKWIDSLENLFIGVNIIVLIAPTMIIRSILIKRNKDKIRPKQPQPRGVKIINGILIAFSAVYIVYQIYVFFLN